MSIESMITERKEEFVRENFLSDQFLDFMKENTKPVDKLMSYYNCAIMEIETKFRVLDEEFSLEYDRNPIESIKSRVKSMDSLLKKIRIKKIPLNIEAIEKNITDIAGVRIICSFQEDIYAMAEYLLRQDDIKLIREKDYIKNPKPNGYRSLHLIVEVPIFLHNETKPMKVEVQLRTIAMDFWASLEHKLRYKKNIPEKIQKQLSNELVECAHICAELDNRMEDIRNDIEAAVEEDEADAINPFLRMLTDGM